MFPAAVWSEREEWNKETWTKFHSHRTDCKGWRPLRWSLHRGKPRGTERSLHRAAPQDQHTSLPLCCILSTDYFKCCSNICLLTVFSIFSPLQSFIGCWWVDAKMAVKHIWFVAVSQVQDAGQMLWSGVEQDSTVKAHSQDIDPGSNFLRSNKQTMNIALALCCRSQGFPVSTTVGLSDGPYSSTTVLTTVVFSLIFLVHIFKNHVFKVVHCFRIYPKESLWMSIYNISKCGPTLQTTRSCY